MTTAFERIRDFHVPLVLERMRNKSADYNTGGMLPFEPHKVLGIKGQWADIWRKVWKLHKALWEGEKLEGEQPLEIIDDMVAHLLLTRDLLIQQEGEQILPVGKTATDVRNTSCGPGCAQRSHKFAGACRYRLADCNDA